MRCLMRGTAFRFFGLAAAFELLVSLPSRGQEAKWPATTEGDYVAKNFKFRSGETLPELRLHYATLGKPERDAQGRVTNAVLILHGTGGSGSQFLQAIFVRVLFAPGPILDVIPYFIILPHALC